MYLPYTGAFAAARRSKEYYQFLGFRAARVSAGYDSLSIQRIKAAAKELPVEEEVPFEHRSFIVVARLVPKKNLNTLLDAYVLYRNANVDPRKLHIFGDGPLERELREHANSLGIGQDVVFHGFVQAAEVCKQLNRSLALLLPSIEEQFGLVVIEAQALGVPVVVSDNCGARDELVRSGVNGFVVEAQNPKGLAFFMGMLSNDEELWSEMVRSSAAFAMRGDVVKFVEGVQHHLSLDGEK
nr:glycosyltransferase [Devosia litorisediminis]